MSLPRWLLVLPAAVAGYWLLLYLLQRSALFPAPMAPPGQPIVPAGEQVWLGLGPGRTEAWLLPSLAGGGVASPLVIFAHGNGELIDFWAEEFEALRRWGVAVLLVEYPGYGRSPGRPSEASVTAAMVAGYDWAAARTDIDAQRIVAYGRSVGSGAACALARERPVAALVLESAFTSVHRMARRYGLPRLLVRDPFDNLAVVRQFPRPVLILHGEADEIIPVSHAHALHQAARSATLHLLPCGHNDCPRPWSLVRQFLADHGLL